MASLISMGSSRYLKEGKVFREVGLSKTLKAILRVIRPLIDTLYYAATRLMPTPIAPPEVKVNSLGLLYLLFGKPSATVVNKASAPSENSVTLWCLSEPT